MSLNQSLFTSGQITFIETLANASGLDPGVIAAWCYQEENGSAATSRQNAGNFNWLNIGYFNTGPGAIAFNSAFSDPGTAALQTYNFLNGTWGGASSGIRAILNTVGQTTAQQIQAIQISGWATSGYPNFTAIFGELDPAFVQSLGKATTGGGVFGAGGTGTPGNTTPTSLWTVGDPSNPDQDYWTTINQYAMSAQWYAFTDAETLFVADGIELMAQQPAAVINRLDENVISLRATWDNTTWQYTHTHTRRARIQRRTSLAKITSPTQVSVRIVCDIDRFRAGDTVVLALCGPADGVWLIGDCTRSIFDPFSDLTLVQAMSPISAATGTPNSTPFLTGPLASQPTSGSVMAAMLSEATTLNNDNYPYVYAGGHAQAGTPSVGSPGNGYDGHTIGFDCSGAVAAVLAAGGLWQFGSSVPADNGIIQQLLSQNKITPGQGSGNPECTLFDNPGVHIFMRLNGKYFGTEDGAGHLPATPSQGAGWIPNGQPGSFVPYHVPTAILGQQASG